MKVNENHCYYCGIEVDPSNYEDLGSTTIWVCGDKKCQKDLQYDIADYVSEQRAQAEDERGKSSSEIP
jgi:hypothetical protein